MDFFALAWQHKWMTYDELMFMVKTEKQFWGQITPEEFKIITGDDFIEEK